MKRPVQARRSRETPDRNCCLVGSMSIRLHECEIMSIIYWHPSRFDLIFALENTPKKAFFEIANSASAGFCAAQDLTCASVFERKMRFFSLQSGRDLTWLAEFWPEYGFFGAVWPSFGLPVHNGSTWGCSVLNFDDAE